VAKTRLRIQRIWPSVERSAGIVPVPRVSRLPPLHQHTKPGKVRVVIRNPQGLLVSLSCSNQSHGLRGRKRWVPIEHRSRIVQQHLLSHRREECTSIQMWSLKIGCAVSKYERMSVGVGALVKRTGKAAAPQSNP